MALKKCEECGKEVSTKAESCPNCGAVLLKKRGFLSFLVVVLLVISLVLAILVIGGLLSYKMLKTSLPNSALTSNSLIDQKPYIVIGDTFEFECKNGSHVIPYAVDLLPEDTFEGLKKYGIERCKEESRIWNKLKNTTGDYIFSTNQFNQFDNALLPKKKKALNKKTTPAVTPESYIGPMLNIPEGIVRLLGEESHYVKFAFTVELDHQEVFEEMNLRMAQIQDMIISSIGGKTYEELEILEGKRQLKKEITEKTNFILQTGRVKSLYFTNFEIK